jgi:alkaline phosphatase D
MSMTSLLEARYALSRRRLFQGLGISAAGLLTPWSIGRAADMVFKTNPFQLGVASGDPDATGFVIWTRLAPSPLEFGSGMPPEAVSVAWEVASDPAMTTVVRSGNALARPELGHSVHVELASLLPDRPYWYRFTVSGIQSPIGRSRTTPAAGAPVSRVRFGVAGCQHYEAGFFTAYRKLAADDVDFIFCYGDYIYEYSSASGTRRGPDGKMAPIPRRHVGGMTYSLDDYRRRYAQYKTDPDLQAAHAAAPWFPVWDDHEIEDNWTGSIDKRNTAPEIFALRRQGAAQAYYENMPLRHRSFPVGTGLQIYRRAAYGQLMELNFLDTRQFRTDQPCHDTWENCNDLDNPSAQVMGLPQEAWLLDGLSASKARWNVVAQQVMMMDINRDIGKGPRYNTDSWAGYRTPRNRVLGQMRDRGIQNAIVLTGDEHINYAGELHLDDRNPGPKPIALEFVGTSISSGYDGADMAPDQDKIMSGNPPLKFMNDQRGYLVCDVTPERWVTEFKVLNLVSTPNGVLSTRAKLAVESGDPRIVTA